MTIHTLSPKFFEDLKFRFLTRTVPFTTVIFFGILWRMVNQVTNNPNFNRLVLGVTIGFGIFVYCIVLGVSTAMIFRQYHRLWQSYQILLEKGSVTRIQGGLEDACITQADIKKITQIPGKSLVIEATNSPVLIAIPETLENFSVVKAILAEWHPIEDISNVQLYLNGPLGGIALLFSPLVLIAIASRITQEPLIVAGGFTLYLVMLLYCAILTIINPNIGRTQRFAISFGMIPIACVIGSVIVRILLA